MPFDRHIDGVNFIIDIGAEGADVGLAMVDHGVAQLGADAEIFPEPLPNLPDRDL